MATNSNDANIAEAMRNTLISPNEADRNSEPANVVDGLFAIARAVSALAAAVDATNTQLMFLRIEMKERAEQD